MKDHADHTSTASIPGTAASAPQLLHFDDATALRLSHAFNEKTQVEDLLRLLFTQLRALCRASGMSYRHTEGAVNLDLDFKFGQQQRHQAEYNLHYRDQALGTLTLYYARAQHEQEIETGEDLLSLTLVPLRNAVTIAVYQAQPQADADFAGAFAGQGNVHRLPVSQAGLSSEEEIALAEVAAGGTREQKADALILVGLDGYTDMQQQHGEEWAHIIMTSVHQQINDGLRSADGVYHIGDDQIAVLLPRTTLSQAQQVAEKIRVLVASLHLLGNEVDNQLTASMGISNAQQAETAEQVMVNARAALAEARGSGANQIKVFSSG